MAYTLYKDITTVNRTVMSNKTNKYIVIHYTGNKTDTAKNNATYFKSVNRNASAHYFVDKTTVYQVVEDKDAAWSVGKNYGSNNLFDTVKNTNSISIEMCSDNGAIADATFNNTVELTKSLMKKYNIPVSNVYRHYDVCSKNCPGWTGWIGSNTTLWNKFKSSISSTSTTTTSELYRVRKTWADTSSQIGAYSSLDNAKAACKEGYSVFDSKGNVIYSKTSTTVSHKYSIGQYVTFGTSYPSSTSPCGITYATGGSGKGKITAIVNGQAKYQIDNGVRYCNDGDISGTYTPQANNSTPVVTAPEKTKVTYMSHCIGNNNWCSEIVGYNTTNSNGYSGILGKSIDKFAVKLSQGTVTYAAHKKGGSWFGEVTGYSVTDTNKYAGATNCPIDAIIIKANGIVGTLKYRVHTKADNKWWGWITGYSKTDPNQYAGVVGREIDAIQISIE